MRLRFTAFGTVGVLLLTSAVLVASSLVLDQSFRAPLISEDTPPGRALLLPDGKFVVYFRCDTLSDARRGAINRFLPDGTLDSSFNFSRDYESVWAAVPLANGQLIVSATQREYGGANVIDRLFRINADGSIDPTFNSQTVQVSQGQTVRTLVFQPDGKILVAGFFDTFAGTARQAIARLMSDGTIDPTFNPPAFNGGIWAKPAIQPDGKIIVGGNFTKVNANTSFGVARLNSDGSLDPSFSMTSYKPLNSGRPVRGIYIQGDGKVVLGGTFILGSVINSPRAPLVRVNSDGSADTSFTLITNFPQTLSLKDLAVQGDGKMLAASSGSVYRFNPNGSLDTNFRQPAFWDWSFHYPDGLGGDTTTIDIYPDGHLLVGGGFEDVDSGTQPSFSHVGAVRLDASGNVDTTMTQTHRTATTVYPTSFVRRADDTTLAAVAPPDLNRIEPSVSNDLFHLQANGATISGPSLTSSNPNGILSEQFSLHHIAAMADGKLLMDGLVLTPDGFSAFAGGKFLPDGTEDLAYRSSNLYLSKSTPLPNGGALFSGDGADAQAAVEGSIVQTRANGSVDSSFKIDWIKYRTIARFGDGTLDEIIVGSRVLARQPDGKIIFIYLDGSDLLLPPTCQFRLVRLNADGSIDNSFAQTAFAPTDLSQDFPVVTDFFSPNGPQTLQPPDGAWTATPPLYDAQVQPDGKIVIGGSFTSFAGVPARGLVRLNTDGTVDTSFAIGGGAQWTQTTETASFLPIVEQVKTELDGKLLIAGTFEAFNGTPLPGIASLTADGSVDGGFSAPVVRQKYHSGTVKLERQADGSFLLAGPYTFPDETEPAGLVRINSVGGAPVVGSPTSATAVVGKPFSYQVVASGQPISYGASGLPMGFNFDAATGVISGTASNAQIGSYDVMLTATNGEGTSAPRVLTFVVPELPRATAAVSRKQFYVSGVLTNFDVDLPVTGRPGIECRSGQYGQQILVTFNNNLNTADATVTAGNATLSNASADGNAVSFELDGVANAQTVTISLHNVVDEFAQPMPDTSIKASFLLGDVNGDGVVNAADATVTRNNSGQTLNGTNFRADLNVDGTINSADATIARNNSGIALPPTAPDEPVRPVLGKKVRVGTVVPLSPETDSE